MRLRLTEMVSEAQFHMGTHTTTQKWEPAAVRVLVITSLAMKCV